MSFDSLRQGVPYCEIFDRGGSPTSCQWISPCRNRLPKWSPHSAGGKSLLPIQGDTDRMARPTPEEIQHRRQRMAEAEGLGGWHLHRLVDGRDSANSEWLSWHEYRHLDGRRATVGDNGRATDPDLQAQLDSRAKALAAGPTPTVAAGAAQRRRWMALRWLSWAWCRRSVR